MKLAEQFKSGEPDPFMTINVHNPNSSFVEVLELVDAMNLEIRDIGITEKLKKWMQKLREIVAAIATAFKAASYAISMSPTGLSVSITFNS